MAEEIFGWLFVCNVPLLCEKKKVARQFQIETWLDLAQVTRELGLQNITAESRNQSANRPCYIV